jgi:thiamine-monophosphate kinase
MPSPRVALGQRLRGIATAALDVSDGLAGDLAHILTASGVGATIGVAALPRSPVLARMQDGPLRPLALYCLLAGGDDYELCFTANATARDRLAALATEMDVPLTRIGTITTGRGLVVHDEQGRILADVPRSFDHFAA